MPDLFIDQAKEKITIKESTAHLFSTFCQLPQNISFSSLGPNESVILFLRKAHVTNIPWIMTTILLMGIPFLLQSLSVLAPGAFPTLSPSITIFSTLFYYLLIVTYAFIQFVTWFFNISIVTDQRIIDIDFKDLLYKNVAQTKLSLIEDVSASQIGGLASIFNYGDVLVQTAGEKDNFEFIQVPHPTKAVAIIEKLIGGKEHV